MASSKVSAAEKKELDKFTKFLALKAAQIIVQSRLGEKIQSQSKPYTQDAEWFNLAIQDLPEVVQETKLAITTEQGTIRLPVCVEISLRTVEGDAMVLETWCLNSLHDQCDTGNRTPYTVYNRMGILLKSLISVTRVTPAYKLSRRQSPDSYVICYRIYHGQAQLHCLGDGYKQVRVGQIFMPVGTLHLSVAYRTKMTISPTQTGSNTSIMLKSDHFKPETDTEHTKNEDDIYVNIMNRPMKRAAFINPESVNYPVISPKPFEKLFEKSCTIQPTEIPLPKSVPKTLSLQISKKKEVSFEEMRPLKMAFTQSDQGDWTKVSHLYWYFKDAPSLESFENCPTIGQQDLVGEIEKHSKQLPTYNALVKELLRSSKDEDDTTDDEIEDKKKLLIDPNKKEASSNSSDTQPLDEPDSSYSQAKIERSGIKFQVGDEDLQNSNENSMEGMSLPTNTNDLVQNNLADTNNDSTNNNSLNNY